MATVLLTVAGIGLLSVYVFDPPYLNIYPGPVAANKQGELTGSFIIKPTSELMALLGYGVRSRGTGGACTLLALADYPRIGNVSCNPKLDDPCAGKLPPEHEGEWAAYCLPTGTGNECWIRTASGPFERPDRLATSCNRQFEQPHPDIGWVLDVPHPSNALPIDPKQLGFARTPRARVVACLRKYNEKTGEDFDDCAPPEHAISVNGPISSP